MGRKESNQINSNKQTNQNKQRNCLSLSGQVLARKNIEEVIKFAKEENLFLMADEVGGDKSHLLFSSAEMFKKPLWQTVWTQIRLLL